ncbi:hypothetical protein LTR23_008053 [Exophiala sp. CCFEE 6169]|uniref:Xylanolytic transcriptional activator regulatory domain-containing protein n=1 Tax=Vermiconidia calcicola TaxID=1690605 RepID=A0AAV9Q378_9PEZI|nr:hypothetical protein LTR18_006836 [Exophiala xenobiotica]KAK5535011.1 hypothetical protein LTR25_006018 [Vermiconidia calcicola]KAK5536191.1 hypothetical protein LTR23_008053 [Chaetothyriales sp. CCFEE 6169]
MGAPIVNDCISIALVIVQSLPDANIRRTPILSHGRIERAMNAAQQDRSAPVNAPFYALEYSETIQSLPAKAIILAGSNWAKTARSLLLESIDEISVENLMTAQLLYDYALRMADFTQAFMLSALMARMTQALQINLEYTTDMLGQLGDGALSITARESRRRLMWSCYITDALCGSGVDQLTLIDDKDIKIQLPCDEQSFLHERPCITRMLNGSPLPFIPAELIVPNSSNNISMTAYFIQHVETRKRVLKYIKHLDKASLPWIPDSEFARFDNELKAWQTSLPADLQFTPSVIYVRKESNQLGALTLLHCAYHQTMCDLYRIGAPALYKLRSAFYFPPEQIQFLRHLQWSLFKAARSLAAVIAEAGRHGPGMVADTWLPSITYDSNRIMLYYLTIIFDPTDQSTKDLVLNTVPYLQSNVQALKMMSATNAVAEGMYHAAESMLEKLGVASNNISPQPHVVLDDPYLAVFGPGGSSAPGTPPQTAPDYVLNPLSIFRMARNDIPERHAPENTRATPSAVGGMASTAGLSLSPEISNQRDSSNDQVLTFGQALDTFFTPNLTWDWQPMETAVGSGMDSEGLLPWVDSSYTNDLAFIPPVSTTEQNADQY